LTSEVKYSASTAKASEVNSEEPKPLKNTVTTPLDRSTF